MWDSRNMGNKHCEWSLGEGLCGYLRTYEGGRLKDTDKDKEYLK